jgi:hypothetical protein
MPEFTNTIKTKANGGPDKPEFLPREVEVQTPECMKIEDLDQLRELVGDQVIVQKFQQQSVIDLRSKVRSQLEAADDNNDPKYDDSAIQQGFTGEDGEITPWSEWQPSVRTVMSTEEKLAKAMSGKDPEAVKAALMKAGFDLSSLA